MRDTIAPPTNPSLLGRLRAFPADQAAWAEFVQRYAAAIYGWCRGQRLQDADAQDVTQGVLAKLAVRMRTFQYEPAQSFRRWLWTVTRHAVSDWHTDHRRRVGEAGGGFALEQAEAREDLHARLAGAFDLELLEEAYERARSQVEPRTWEAFRLTAVDGVPGTEAAARLGMTVGGVYMARSNVQKRIREEVRRLDRE